MRNSWGVVAARDRRVCRSVRKSEKDTALRDFVVDGGEGRCTLKTVRLELKSLRVTEDISNDLKL